MSSYFEPDPSEYLRMTSLCADRDFNTAGWFLRRPRDKFRERWIAGIIAADVF